MFFLQWPRSVVATLLLLLLLLLTAGIYWPGLNGTFLLDTPVNLRVLEQFKDLDSWDAVYRFVLSGFSGPTGRPLSMLSFVWDAPAWPGDPWRFKFVNLMVHLLNGALLFRLALALAEPLRVVSGRRFVFAWLAAAFWLLHPLNVSSVLYVIQRMNQLATLFTLAGLLLYVVGRFSLAVNPRRGYLLMSVGIGLFTVLAILAKESGVLLPLYALVIEGVLLHDRERGAPRLWRLWSAVFLALPPLLMLLYFMRRWENLVAGFQFRTFDMGQRLLTETRVVTDYIAQILLPRTREMGLFHDDFVISRGVLDPPSTLAALLFLGFLAGFAVYGRRRWKPAAFGIAWFFVGHLLESTFLNLELYFEHRNYLPMAGPVMALAFYLLSAPAKFQSLAKGGAGIYLLLFIFLTWQNTTLWGQPLLQAEVWANAHPGSVRAQIVPAEYRRHQGRLREGRAYLERALEHRPRHLGTRMARIQYLCLEGALQRSDMEELIARLATDDYFATPVAMVTKLNILRDEGQCPLISLSDIHRFIDGLLSNPHFNRDPKVMGNLHYYKGTLLANDSQRLDQALAQMDLAAKRLPDRAGIPMVQAAWLAAAGRNREALLFIEKAAAIDHRAGLLAGAHAKTIQGINNAIRNALAREMAP